MKVLLAIEHRGSSHAAHDPPNDHIHFEATTSTSPTGPCPRPRGDRPRTAAVGAFGIGGVDARVIVQEPPPTPSRHSLRQDSYLVKVGGAGEAVVRRIAGAYAGIFNRLGCDGTGLACADNVGRAPQRSKVVVRRPDRQNWSSICRGSQPAASGRAA